jgi:hypothetical protein
VEADLVLPLLERHWLCPNCDSVAVTRDGATPMHLCRGLTGLLVPLVPEGVRCKVEAVEREDYVGSELVQTDGEGRPVMAAVTTRDEGMDTTVYAPTAQAEKD